MFTFLLQYLNLLEAACSELFDNSLVDNQNIGMDKVPSAGDMVKATFVVVEATIGV